MKNKLPVREIFHRGLRMPFERYQALLRLTWPYVVLVLARALFEPEEAAKTDPVLFWGTFILNAIVGLLAMVSAHRVFLMPEEEVIGLRALRWSSVETDYLGAMLGVIAISMAIFLPLTIFSSGMTGDEEGVGPAGLLLVVGSVIFWSYAMARLSLVLPAAALDKEWSFRWSWRLAGGNSLRLCLLIYIAPVAGQILLGVLAVLLSSGWTKIVLELVSIVVVAIQLCLLSLCYEWLTRSQASEGVVKLPENERV